MEAPTQPPDDLNAEVFQSTVAEGSQSSAPGDTTHTIDTDLGTSLPGVDQDNVETNKLPTDDDQAQRLLTIPLDDLPEDDLPTSPDHDFSVSPFSGQDSSIRSALTGLKTREEIRYDPNTPPGKELDEVNDDVELTDPVADPTLNTTADGESAAPQNIEDIK